MHQSATNSHESNPTKLICTWSLADVVDFEFLLEQDRELAISDLEARDQKIAHTIKACQPDACNDRRRLFRVWLEQRRADETETLLTGSTVVAAKSALLKIVAIAAFILGSATAYNLLRYNGTEPVNVATYLGWLVLTQIGIIGFALVALLLRRIGWLSAEASLLTGLVKTIWSALAIRLNRHLLDRVPAEKRRSVESFFGSSNVFRQLYGGVAIWPLIGALQWFGICFNVAAIITTVALVVFSDRAFGWQSAVNFSPEQIHQLTQTLATPWSSIVPSAAAPTLAQIAGSKIVLKDGIRQLTTANLVAWWPFLVASVIVYGFLPRFALWIFTIVMERRALRHLTFEHVACDRLYERLTAHRFQSQAAGPEPKPVDETQPTRSPQSTLSIDEKDAVILMGEELRRQIDESSFAKLILARFRLKPSHWLAWSESSASRGHLLDEVKNVLSSTDFPPIVILEEAWQAPIAEKLDNLRALRNAIGATAKIIVVLVGRPKVGNILTPAKPSDLRVWEKRLQTLADPQLRIEPLIVQEPTNT